LSATAGCLAAGPAGRNAAANQGLFAGGAWICGEPAWDPDFNTADLPILLQMAKVSNRYAKHYLE